MEYSMVVQIISSNPSPTTLCILYVRGILVLCPSLQDRILVDSLYHMML